MGIAEDQTHPESKALGITWSTVTDELSFAAIRMDLPTELDKRSALACLMSFYSPDGLGTPFRNEGQVPVQANVGVGTRLEGPLPITFAKKWTNWFHSMGHVPFIKYPRSVGSKIDNHLPLLRCQRRRLRSLCLCQIGPGHPPSHGQRQDSQEHQPIHLSPGTRGLHGSLLHDPKLTKVYELPLEAFHISPTPPTPSTGSVSWTLSAPPYSSQIGYSEGEHSTEKLAPCPWRHQPS